MKFKLPLTKKAVDARTSRRGAIALMVLLLLTTGLLAAMLVTEFPWNGNPINWLRAKEFAEQGNRALKKYALNEAEEKFRAAVQTYPDDWKFHQGLALSLMEQAEPRAQLPFREVLRLNPKNPEAYLQYAEFLLKAGKLTEAEKTLRKGKEIDARDARLRAALALTLALENKPADADKEFQASNSMEKDSAEYWYLSGKYHIVLGDWQRAEAELKQASSIDKTSAKYWEELGTLVLRRNDFSNAELFIRRACLLNPGKAIYWKELADVCRRNGDLTKAEEAYRKAFELDGKNAEMAFLLGLTLLVQERFKEAELPLKKALELDQNDNSKWSAYINCLEKQKKYAEAESNLERLLALPGKNKMMRTWVFLSSVQLEEGKLQAAQESANKAKTMAKDASERKAIDQLLQKIRAGQKK